MRTKILIVLFTTCLLSSHVNALTLLSLRECRGISLIFFGAATVFLSIGIPLLTVETDALGRHVCPSEIKNCTKGCIYKDCENCITIPVFTNSMGGCVRNDTLVEVGQVFQRSDSARAAGITFTVIGSVTGFIGLVATASVEQGINFRNSLTYG